MTPAEEIRALADRAMTDAQSERQAANDALIRASCYEDKAHELIALADRIEREEAGRRSHFRRVVTAGVVSGGRMSQAFDPSNPVFD